MPHKKPKSVSQLEIEENELIEISILKRDLLALLADYKSSRIGLISFIFRDHQLTKEKLMIVDETAKFIKNFEGSKQDFERGLIERRLINAEISRQYGKYHYNLLGRREKLDCDGEVYHLRKEGETWESDLAEVFHEAISMVSNRMVSNYIRNKLYKK